MPKSLPTLFLFGLSLIGLAHAEYKSSVPKSGATLKQMPSQVQLVFTEKLEVKLSTFKVYRLQAQPGSLNSAQLRSQARALYQQVLLARNDQDKRWDTGVQTTARTTNAVTLGLKPGLKPGAYVVMWQNLGADGHRVRGFFTFVFAP